MTRGYPSRKRPPTTTGAIVTHLSAGALNVSVGIEGGEIMKAMGSQAGQPQGPVLAAAAAGLVVLAAAVLIGLIPHPAEAQTTTELCDPAGTEQFTDIAPEDYASEYVLCMRALELSQGRGADTYGADRNLNRGQMATFLIRLWTNTLGNQCPTNTTTPFTDIAGTTHADSITCLYGLGLTQGTSPTTYSPQASLKASQITRFLYRTHQKTGATCPTGASDSELDQATTCLLHLRVTPSETEATSPTPVTRSQMAVYLIGLWHNLTGRGLPPTPPQLNQPTTTQPQPQQRGPGLDVWDRAAVVAAYIEEFGRDEPEWGYTGDVGECVAGTTSQAFRDSVVQRVNWYRQMAGLNPVTENTALSVAAQEKALIMLAEGGLSHYPTPDWACYRDIDISSVGENLFLGVAGVAGVDGYIRDPGDHNLAVGHRMQILSPFVREIGTGDVRSSSHQYSFANAMHLDYDFDLDPKVREERGFIAWPPAGYVPARAVWGRWSFSMKRIKTETTRSGNTVRIRRFLAQPDFSLATVSVTDDNGPVETTIIHRDTALVWAMEGDTDSRAHAEPTAGDRCYTVTIAEVRTNGTEQTPYEYAVCVISSDMRSSQTATVDA